MSYAIDTFIWAHFYAIFVPELIILLLIGFGITRNRA